VGAGLVLVYFLLGATARRDGPARKTARVNLVRGAPLDISRDLRGGGGGGGGLDAATLQPRVNSSLPPTSP